MKRLLALLLCFGLVSSMGIGIVGCDKGTTKKDEKKDDKKDDKKTT